MIFTGFRNLRFSGSGLTSSQVHVSESGCGGTSVFRGDDLDGQHPRRWSHRMLVSRLLRGGNVFRTSPPAKPETPNPKLLQKP